MKQRLLGPLVAAAALVFAAVPGQAYTLYGYEDDYGLVHLSEERVNDQYALIFEGPADPHMGFAEIKKRIQALGAVSKDRKDGWILEATRAYGRMATAPLGPGGFPPVIESGPLLELVREKSRAFGLDPELVYAVIEQESRFSATAVSPKGAAGLMQLMPATQETYGVLNPFDPVRNVTTGTRHLKAMLNRFKDLRLALAAYNAGPETVARSGGVPAIPETINYVQRIMARYAMLKDSHPGMLPKTLTLPKAAAKNRLADASKPHLSPQ